jgi:hypothetical protein
MFNAGQTVFFVGNICTSMVEYGKFLQEDPVGWAPSGRAARIELYSGGTTHIPIELVYETREQATKAAIKRLRGIANNLKRSIT